MDPSKLTSYRDAARVAAKLADFYKDFAGLTVGMQMLIGNDIPTLATAVDELVAEVERLQKELSAWAYRYEINRGDA